MTFEIDTQTLKDLNVFSADQDNFSLYRLFKNCKTLGGRDKLALWMKNPIADINFLRDRVSALDFLGKQNLKVGLENSQIDLILHHLAQDKNVIRSNPIQISFAYLKNIFGESQAYYVIKVGIHNLANVINQCADFSAKIKTSGQVSLVELSLKIEKILEDDFFARLKSINPKRKPTFYELIQLNALVHAHKLKVFDLLDVVYEIDVLLTITKTGTTLNYTLPRYSEGQCIMEAEDLFHPILKNPVKNQISIDEFSNVTFLTGSNMGGKSSLLKAIGIAVYLAHLGFPVPAKMLEVSVFDGMITSINLPDSIESGLSHYLSEVMRVKKVLSSLANGNKLFVVLDELFKGTNAKDASEATELVIKGFAEVKGSTFIISSHINELSHKFDSSNIKLLQMEHLVVDEKPIFTYKLKEGISRDGIGMYFVKQENIYALLEQAKAASVQSVQN